MISEVYNIDCNLFMRDLPDKFFELACVDPEFGIGNFWMKQRATYKYGKEKNWNSRIPSKKYFSIYKSLLQNSGTSPAFLLEVTF